MSLPVHNLTPARVGQSPAQSNAPGAPTPPGGGPSRPTYSKRGKITIVACVNCRRRKTKCDGQRPQCSQCKARDGAQCHYDMNEEQRRLTYLRENVEQLHEEKTSLETLIQNLRVSSEEEAIEILRRIRHGTDPQTLSQNIQAGRALAQVSQPGSEGTPASTTSGQPDTSSQLLAVISQAGQNEMGEIIRRLQLREDAGGILNAVHNGSLLQPLEKSGSYSNAEQAFGLTRVTSGAPRDTHFSGAQSPHALATHHPLPLHGSKSVAWMNPSVTSPMDQEIISQSLGLYFSWQHCFFQSFPERLFVQDMTSGSTKHCSRLLVNAVSSAGCHLSPWSQLPGGNQRPNELARISLDEATRELGNIDVPSIPSVAGLIILAQLEGKRGRMHQAWDYCGRGARMALDLALHLRNEWQELDEVELQARDHTFWGCFIADQLISFTLGRVPQIPVTAVTIDLPVISKEDDAQAWESYGDGTHSKKPGGRSTTFHAVASLSKILNSTLFLFFAPSQVLKGSLLLDEYQKYKTWYAKLPSIVQLSDDAAPHVLTLHMYYHAAVLLLFRPFLKAKFTQSDISPQDVCRSSAAAISQIFDQHRRLYDSIGLYTLQIHCLLAACTVHIINIPAIASTQYLTSAARHFQDLATLNGWAGECINILKDLVSKWNIILPMEAENALYATNHSTPTPMSPSVESDSSGRHKRAAFAQPNMPPATQQKKPKIATPRIMQSQSSGSDITSQPSSQGRPSLLPEGSSGISNAPGAGYLFTPFPGQPPPMIAPFHTSDSLETALQGQMSSNFLSEFDGMTFDLGSGDGWLDTFMAYDATGVTAESRA